MTLISYLHKQLK